MKGDPVRIGAVDSLVLATACASTFESAVAKVVNQLAIPGLALFAHVMFWAKANSFRALGTERVRAVRAPTSVVPSLSLIHI